MKQDIRDKMRDKRERLEEEDVQRMSSVICAKVRETLEYRQAERIMLYFPMRNEVDTQDLLRVTISEKTLLLPYLEDGIRAVRVDNLDTLVPGPYGTLQPEGESDEPDLIIVPGLAFDNEGYRIGYGKGHYDRYLEGRDVPIIGLAYGFQVLDEVPREPHDVAMSLVITEEDVDN